MTDDMTPTVPPTMCRTVVYTLSADDAIRIRQARIDRNPIVFGNAGTVHPPGNEVHAGDLYPAVIIRAWNDRLVNLQVLLDGPDSYWATSRPWSPDRADQGTWAYYPARVEAPAVVPGA